MNQKQLDELLTKVLIAKFNEGINLLKKIGLSESELYRQSEKATKEILSERKGLLWTETLEMNK